MRIVFMGTPDFAVPVLGELISQGHEIAAVYTRVPKPAGRGMVERRSPVHEYAKQFGLPVRHPLNFKASTEVAEFLALQADIGVVVAYGLILPIAVLEAPKFGCVNLHASLLPRWRGAAPIQRAILEGDELTGVAVMQMEAGLDTGPVGMVEAIVIGDANAGQIHDRLSRLGADLMVRALAAIERGSLGFVAQAETGITYAKKIEKSECRIDFNQDSQTVQNHIRAFSPFPAAYFEADFGKGVERIKVLAAQAIEGAGAAGEVLPKAGCIACKTGALQLLKVQRAGKTAMRMEDFLRGAIWPAGVKIR